MTPPDSTPSGGTLPLPLGSTPGRSIPPAPAGADFTGAAVSGAPVDALPVVPTWGSVGPAGGADEPVLIFTGRDIEVLTLLWDDGLCAQTDPEIFYPEKGGSTRDARSVCSRCPVSVECMDYALGHEVESMRFGIWGGSVPRERKRIVQRRDAMKESA